MKRTTKLAADTNERVAAWCEEKPTKPPTDDPDISPQGFWCAAYEAKWYSRHDFATSRDACEKFEALVEERERMWPKYTTELFMILAPLDSWYLLTTGSGSTSERWTEFRFATATSQQRCQALLLMVEAEEREGP